MEIHLDSCRLLDHNIGHHGWHRLPVALNLRIRNGKGCLRAAFFCIPGLREVCACFLCIFERMNTRKTSRFRIPVILLFVLLLVACRHDVEELTEEPKDESLAPEYYAGGSTTVFRSDVEAYNQVLANASPQVIDAFQQGVSIFLQDYQAAGSMGPQGLGPIFIQPSCVACHPMNGRSHAPTDELGLDSGLLMRFSLAGSGEHGEPLPVPGFGNQLQSKAIEGVTPEGQFTYVLHDMVETYPDGSYVLMHQPLQHIVDPYIPLPPNILYSMRLGSPVYGLGLLEAVPEEEILSRADETDSDQDYISGRPNYVWDVKNQAMALGRFGWKASAPNLDHQTAAAFHDDMGITSTGYFPVEVCDGQSNCGSGVGTLPDIDESTVHVVADYLRAIAVPAPRNLDDPQVMRGRELFDQVSCSKCHTPELHTGNAIWPELSNQTIYPYTDMLIHDLGEILADGRPDFEASTNEWRTAPLWGIGLTKLIHPSAGFLHDGRADTLEEAILWHGGEAHWSKEAFKQLSPEDRAALIAFLEAL